MEPQYVPSLLTNTQFTNVTGGQVVMVEKMSDNKAMRHKLMTSKAIRQPGDMRPIVRFQYERAMVSDVSIMMNGTIYKDQWFCAIR